MDSSFTGNEDRLIRLPEVLRLVRVGKSTWWQGVRDGIFPQPVRFGKRITAWRASDLKKFIDGLK